MHVEEKTDTVHLDSVHAEDAPIDDYRVGWHTFLAILSLAIANCCATLSNTTNTTIRFQVQSVGGAQNASWIANGNFLLTLACGPIFGSLSDRLGKKWFIVVGGAIGVIGSFVSSSADHVGVIIAGNILTGIANAGCITSVAANQEIMPNKLRPYAFGFAQTVNSIAAIAGTFTAAAFVKYASWRWSYRLNGIVYAISALAVLATYFPPPTAIRRTGELGKILMSVDYVGILLLTGSFASLLIGLTWGGSTYAWSSGVIIGTLVAGCVGLVICGLFEWLVKKENALFDHRLFETANFSILALVCLIDGMLLLGVNVLFAQEIADLFTQDSVKIASVLAPFLVTSTIGCLPAGYIMGKTKSFKILLIVALTICALFTGLMALVNQDRKPMAEGFSAVFGIGTAVTTVIPIVALGLSVPSFLLGTAGTLSISARALGGITGVTIFTAIYDNKIAVNLPKEVGAVVMANGGNAELIKGVIGALMSPAPPPVALQQVPGLSPKLIGPILAANTVASAESWKFVWVAIACITFAGAILTCFVSSVKGRMTEHVESALEKSATRDSQFTSKR
ncbi:MFS general substrate transporter [Myriangium duriaei CBS 260.36]|uniref:MFS general substrate transporter n=1 Tax=Myriangium duriaei CBS 260.36 TaxID=1168546 RepID=A0A9P4MKN1_9PEZI|nr:MFS general substrate transporter [Myriangium duriaei CBS 260.36]